MTDDNDPAEMCRRLAAALEEDDATAIDVCFKALSGAEPGPRKAAIADIRDEDDGETLLHLAAADHSYNRVALELIAWGADIHATSEDGTTPLRRSVSARSRGDTEPVVLALLEAGADPSGLDRYDLTALHHAAGSGSETLVRTLIEAGCDVDAVDGRDREKTPLHDAARNGNAAVIPCLLAAGADRDRANAEGESALCLAVSHGHREATQRLIEAGCRIDRPDNRGRTPLHFAVRNGEADLIRDLVGAGASVLTRDDLGQSPLEILQAFGEVDSIRAVKGARPWPVPGPLDAQQRLSILVTIVMQNWPACPEFVDTSFYGTMHGRNFWLEGRCERLGQALAGLADDRSWQGLMPRTLARICFDIARSILLSYQYHANPNDGFELENVDEDDLYDAVDSFENAAIRFFTGDEGMPDDLTVKDIVRRDIMARALISRS